MWSRAGEARRTSDAWRHDLLRMGSRAGGGQKNHRCLTLKLAQNGVKEKRSSKGKGERFLIPDRKGRYESFTPGDHDSGLPCEDG